MADDIKKVLEERFNSLPDAVQKAILSGHIQEKFQELARKHQLHVDAWQQVENKIMLTVLGVIQPEELVDKIVNETNVGAEKAATIVSDIALSVFKPIREELERELGHPQAREEVISDIEKVRQEVLSQAPAPQVAAPVPATPPNPLPTEKVARAPASGAYKPGETSVERADVHDDPYREPPL
ncbi:MAG: hypothetical protein G01um10148_99 [Parcubacteria group bacterium Gr01-1014_8]|nr:MAG: hypothetical protein G01um10148_99 [Parcubacteria group bacterium Gr01-1014_8]